MLAVQPDTRSDARRLKDEEIAGEPQLPSPVLPQDTCPGPMEDFLRRDVRSQAPLATAATARDTASVELSAWEVSLSLHELETAVTDLSADELATFKRWFDEFLADAWDRRIEADIRAGRLDEAGRRADADFEAGRCKPL